jgi:hypothetical protein
MLVGGGCSAESCSGGIRNSAEKGISREQTVRFLLRRYSKYAEHHVYSSILSRISCSHGQGFNTAYIPILKSAKFPAEQNQIPPEQKLLCGKSSSICKSRAKEHPDGRHFEKIRV